MPRGCHRQWFTSIFLFPTVLKSRPPGGCLKHSWQSEYPLFNTLSLLNICALPDIKVYMHMITELVSSKEFHLQSLWASSYILPTSISSSTFSIWRWAWNGKDIAISLLSPVNSQVQDVLLHLIYGLTELILAHDLELVKCTGENLLTTVFILMHCREFFKWKSLKKQGHFKQPIMNNNRLMAEHCRSSSSFGFHLIKSFISTGSVQYKLVSAFVGWR